MTVQLGNPLLRKVPETRHLIKLDRPAVNAYLRVRHPGLTDEERNEILTMRDRWHEMHPGDALVEAQSSTDYHKRKFVAAMWLLGASQFQLGLKMGVRQQTIQRHVRIELPQANRASLRLGTKMEEHVLESYRELYYRMIEADAGLFESKSALEVAHLFTGVPLTTEKDEVKPQTLESAIEQAFDSTGDQS